MKAIIVIPTLNEEKSIPVLIDKLSIFLKTFTVLFVDDNSSDETQSRIKKSKKKYKNINYIFKTNNFGIGNAIKDGIEFAYKHGYDMCITMDADGTHNPNKIYSMLKIMKSRKYDIISTNRFAIKNSIDNWSFYRIFLTKFRYYLVRILLGTKLDSSGNFRIYNLRKIKKKHLFVSKNSSYFFLIESLFYLEKFYYKIHEVPIKLHPRTFDHSKMKIGHILMSLYYLIKLRLNIFKY